jgi:lysophospholipase L1-like esterase
LKKLFALILIIGLPIMIYLLTVDHGIYYVALGDSLAAGQNPYGKISYGYTDNVADYLDSLNKLTFYTKQFAVSGYRTTDLIKDINDNKSIEVDGKKITLKQALAKADIITLSIGANDLFYKLGINSMDITFQDDIELKKYVDEVILDIEKLIILIKKYCMEDIILVGYYNPLWHMKKDFAKQIDNVILYANNEMKKVSNKYDLYFVDVYKQFEQNSDFLPNPIDIHPSAKGYAAITEKIIKIINEKIID